jgi:lincosamide nucleotidyltransferase A/C/D/E
VQLQGLPWPGALNLGRCLGLLGGLGYVAETDWLPSRIELRAPGERWVDVHPVAFGGDGSGRQAGLGGGFFEYPPGAFDRGRINDRPTDAAVHESRLHRSPVAECQPAAHA